MDQTLTERLAGCDENSHPSWGKRTRRALGRLSRRGVHTTTDLIDRFADLPAATRADAAYLLGRLDDKRLAPFLIQRFAEERSSKTRFAIIRALGRFGGKRALRALCDWTGDRTQRDAIRHAACYELTFFHHVVDVAWLIDQLLAIATSPREDPFLRSQAIEAIATHLDGFDRRRRPWRRAAAALIPLLAHPSGEIRFWTMFTLGTIRAERARPAIADLAARDDFVGSMGWSNREEAADILYRLDHGTWSEPDAQERALAAGTLRPSAPPAFAAAADRCDPPGTPT